MILARKASGTPGRGFGEEDPAIITMSMPTLLETSQLNMIEPLMKLSDDPGDSVAEERSPFKTRRELLKVGRVTFRLPNARRDGVSLLGFAFCIPFDFPDVRGAPDSIGIDRFLRLRYQIDQEWVTIYDFFAFPIAQNDVMASNGRED
jgi:hypothetical protein